MIELKLRASEFEARDDFSKLDLMFEKLNYPPGIFLNIDSNETFFDQNIQVTIKSGYIVLQYN